MNTPSKLQDNVPTTGSTNPTITAAAAHAIRKELLSSSGYRALMTRMKKARHSTPMKLFLAETKKGGSFAAAAKDDTNEEEAKGSVGVVVVNEEYDSDDERNKEAHRNTPMKSEPAETIHGSSAIADKSTALGVKTPTAKAKSTTSPNDSKTTPTTPLACKCEESDEFFNIKEVLAYRVIKKHEYLLRFECKGYPDSWFPEDELSKGALKDAKHFRNYIEEYGAYPVGKKKKKKKKTMMMKDAKSSKSTPVEVPDDKGELVIEKFLAYRTTSVVEYLIAWENYEGEDSWVPEGNLTEYALEFAKQLQSDVMEHGAYPAPN